MRPTGTACGTGTRPANPPAPWPPNSGSPSPPCKSSSPATAPGCGPGQPATLTISNTDLRTAYAAGATITALAHEYGCSTSLIWPRLNFHTPPGNYQPAGHDPAGSEQTAQLSAAPPTVLRMPDGRLPIGPICAAIVDRLTFGGNIIETGTDSYRLAHTRQRLQEAPPGRD